MTVNAPASNRSSYFLYVGVYGKGIYGFGYDSQRVSLEALGLLGEITNPSFLATDSQNRWLYAVSELEGEQEGAVGAFSINRKTGHLTPLNTASTKGVAPCHLAVDRTSKFLAVANYGTGSVAGFHLQRNGSLGSLSSFATARGSSVDPKRQTGPHAHQVVFSANNKFLYVPDLGLDQIRIYDLDAEVGSLSPHHPASVNQTPGMGPRHMALSPDDRFAYLVNELQSMVTVFEHNAELATFKPLQTISSLPENPGSRDGAAAILVHPNGRFVYASNRGPGTIAVYTRHPDNGQLQITQIAETGGTFPRAVEIDPSGSYLFVGDQKENWFAIFAINADTGKLERTGKTFETPSPVSFLFTPAG